MIRTAAIPPYWVEEAYRRACELELQALKPGNVHVHSDGHGMCVQDFRTSAFVSAGLLTSAGLGLGERIHAAIRATQDAVACNTNLGIVLLAAPLISAMAVKRADECLRDAVRRVLAKSTKNDAAWVYRAIREAAPAGLGEVQEHDINAQPLLALQPIMACAADRDRVARQLANGYADVFDVAVPRLRALQARWRDPRWAVTGLYMDLLGRWPDSHVGRKYGEQRAVWLRERVAGLATSLTASEQPELFRDPLMKLDADLKELGLNPGTTADLTVATVLVVGLEELLSNSSGSGLDVQADFEQLSACL